MNLDVTVVIPCHNDRSYAENLAREMRSQSEPPRKVMIVHNGCERPDALPFANKSKATNYAAQKVRTDFTLILDADMRLSKFFMEALSRAIRNERLDAGGGLVLVENMKHELVGMSGRVEYTGCAFFVKTDILKRMPLPESSIVEDVCYTLDLQKAGYKIGHVTDAIAYHAPTERDTMLVIFKRMIRYQIGSLELMRKNRTYMFGGLGTLFSAIFAIPLFVFVGWSVLVISPLGLVWTSVWVLAMASLFVMLGIPYVLQTGRKTDVVLGSLQLMASLLAVAFVINHRRIW